MQSRHLLHLAGLALLTFVAALAVEHVVEPDLSPLRHMISEYVNSGTGPLMELGFVTWTASWVLLAAEFARRRWRVPAVALAMSGAGAALVTLFHTQTVAGKLPAGVARNTGGRLHDLGGELIIVGVLVASAAVAGRRGSSVLVRWVATGLLGVALVASAALLAAGDPAPGIRQRVLIAAAVGWQALIMLDTEPPGAPPGSVI